MKNLSDESLVALYAQGKDSAFDELLYRHKDNLYSYIYSYVQNRDMTEDFFQDTFTKVIYKIRTGQYQESGKFVGFLFRVARNTIIDHYRQTQTAQIIKESDVDYDIFGRREMAYEDFDTCREEELSYKQVLQDVRTILDFLPENQKEIVRMRYYEDLPFKEIADKLGVSINTALGRFRYAVLNMRKLAEDHHVSLYL